MPPAQLMASISETLTVVFLGAVLMTVALSSALVQADAHRPGRMTGGGSVIDDGFRTTHGFELHCKLENAPVDQPNNLEVNWNSEDRFHLENLLTAVCTNDPNIDENPPVAGFDTYKGSGTGSYNGVPGATAEWKFTDAGEPGVNDFMSIKITDAGGNIVLDVSGTLTFGNHQAHKA